MHEDSEVFIASKCGSVAEKSHDITGNDAVVGAENVDAKVVPRYIVFIDGVSRGTSVEIDAVACISQRCRARSVEPNSVFLDNAVCSPVQLDAIDSARPDNISLYTVINATVEHNSRLRIGQSVCSRRVQPNEHILYGVVGS